MDDKKTEMQLLEGEISYKSKNVYEEFYQIIADRIDEFITGYMDFINRSKTERECTKTSIAMLEERGFVPYNPKQTYRPGDKIYFNNRSRSLIAAVIGTQPLEEGVNICAAHIDSPRLDLKQNPIYEDTELAFLKTHYYGGIKKYQWVTIPLSIHGVIVKKDGQAIDIVIGEDEDDPVFCVNDLLPHLSRKTQNKRLAPEVIKGEELNVLIGSVPVDDKKVKEKVKLNVLKLLYEKYGVVESDFLSADLEIVPAFRARYVGFDRSMIGAYGQDDRVCAYTILRALLDVDKPVRTAVCVLADKEETGSAGNTGLASDMLRHFLSLLCRAHNALPELALMNSRALSADVNAALDPTFPDVMEKRNASYLSYGPVVTKFTGSGGKSNTSEAPAEFMAQVRRMLDDAGIPWQIGELGKVDEGGGGTVAQFLANLGIETVDVGVALLSMHSPFEIASAPDIMAAYMGFRTFYL